MARFRLTGTRGQRVRSLRLSVGAAIVDDAIEISFDVTRLTERDALQLLDQVKALLYAHEWPVSTAGVASFRFDSEAARFDSRDLSFDMAA